MRREKGYRRERQEVDRRHHHPANGHSDALPSRSAHARHRRREEHQRRKHRDRRPVRLDRPAIALAAKNPHTKTAMTASTNRRGASRRDAAIAVGAHDENEQHGRNEAGLTAHERELADERRTGHGAEPVMQLKAE